MKRPRGRERLSQAEILRVSLARPRQVVRRERHVAPLQQDLAQPEVGVGPAAEVHDVALGRGDSRDRVSIDDPPSSRGRVLE